MKGRRRYYGWCLRIWFITTFQGSIVDRLYAALNILFRGEVAGLSYPSGPTYPKWNKRTEAFDRFYTWGRDTSNCQGVMMPRFPRFDGSLGHPFVPRPLHSGRVEVWDEEIVPHQ